MELTVAVSGIGKISHNGWEFFARRAEIDQVLRENLIIGAGTEAEKDTTALNYLAQLLAGVRPWGRA